MHDKISIILFGFLVFGGIRLYGQSLQPQSIKHSAINNKGFYASQTSGFYNNGVVLSAIANSSKPILAQSAVCGFVDGRTASKYPGRDAVAFYAENNNPAPLIVYNAKFEKNKIILPKSFDLSQLSEGDYVDVFNNGYTRISEGNKTRWTSIVDSIDFNAHSIRVKYGGFYRVQEGGSDIVEIPTKGSVVYFKLTTKIWSLNSMVISRAIKNNMVKNICGYELDVNNNVEGCYAEGMSVVSIGKIKGDIAYSVEGKWDAGYLARNPSISFYSRDYGDGTNKYVLRQDYMENGKHNIVGYIDKDFTYHQGNGFINLSGDDPCIQTTNGNIRFAKNGGIMMGDYSFWFYDGKIYVKHGAPQNATDGKPLMENSSGKYSDRPHGNVKVGEMYFCTDRSTPESDTKGIAIYYKGDGVWVDALGRIVR